MLNHNKGTYVAGSMTADGTQKKTPRINANPSYAERCTSFHSMGGTYGELLVGEKGIEFYNEKNERDFIQIPWEEVVNVSAALMFGGKRITRFFVNTRQNGSFAFSVRDNKAALRAIREYVGNERVVRENTVIDNLKKVFARRNQ